VAHPILITGSAGFIGSHVCDRLATGNGSRTALFGLDLNPTPAPFRSFRADIRCADQLRQIASVAQPATVIHLAAKAEVVIPFGELGDLVVTNVNGTLNVLEAMQPQRIVFASSSAVYGNAGGRGARAGWSDVHPLGAYGISKAAAEVACREWVRHTGGVAVSLRFGNVVGKRCRGLIAYLVEHALEHPDGGPAARLRGDGELLRDYVPVGYAVSAIARAAELPLTAASSTVFNVGSGRAMTNRAVASIVQGFLRRNGLELRLDFSLPPAPGEASRLVLDTTATTRKLGMPSPTEDEIVEAIEEAALDYLAPVHWCRP
jgi:UDP-glucose 4-epimerase